MPDDKKRNVAKVLLHYLALEDANYLFGVPGAAIKTLLKEIKDNPNFHYIVCRHESGAAFIADGYYRATGLPGVVAVTSGPGATNALTGILTAESGGSAVIAITGEVAEKALGRGFLQEGLESGLDIPAIFTAATHYSAHLTNLFSAKTLIEQALRNAMAVPRHAVHLSVPEDIAAEKLAKNYPTLPERREQYRTTTIGNRPSESDVRQACESIFQAKRPLIFLGSGCRDAMRDGETRDAFHRLVHTYAIPVMTTPDGKGLFPEDDRYSIRSYGCASCRWPHHWLKELDAPDRCDALLVIGTALGNLSTNWWKPILLPQGPFIQVDIDPSVIGRAFNITHGIVADARQFILSLSSCLSAREPNQDCVAKRQDEVDKMKETVSPFAQKAEYEIDPELKPIHWSDYDSCDDTNGIEPAALVRVMQEVIDEQDSHTMLFIDAGNCVGWGAHYFVVKSNIEYHGNLRMGPMGFGTAGVIGAKFGKNLSGEDCNCIALVGDGAFLMHGAEVSTAKALKAGAIWVVLAEDDLRMVTQGMSWWAREDFEDLYKLGNADLVMFAQGLGADAVEVATQDELKDALRNALQAARGSNQTPQAIVVRINPDRFPPYYLAPYGPPVERDSELARQMLAKLSARQ